MVCSINQANNLKDFWPVTVRTTLLQLSRKEARVLLWGYWLTFPSHRHLEAPLNPTVWPASARRKDAVCFPFPAVMRFHHPIILHSHVRRSVLLSMLIEIGCFGLWHRRLALAVNCSFLSHLAKELKPAIFWVRIRHLKKNVHRGKPLTSAEGKKGAGSRMIQTRVCSDVISKRGTQNGTSVSWHQHHASHVQQEAFRIRQSLFTFFLKDRSYPSLGPSLCLLDRSTHGLSHL